MWIFIGIVTIACITCFIIGDIQERKKKKENHQPEAETDKIKSVTILGTRTGEQTKILGTYNFTIYSFLVEYESEKREAVECEADSAQFKKLIMYVKTNNQTTEQ